MWLCFSDSEKLEIVTVVDDECERLDCIHGSCRKNNRGEARCDCYDGFTGESCETGRLALVNTVK